MAVVIARSSMAVGMALALPLALGGCVISSLFIDLDAYYEDGEIWFEDSNQSWLLSHCVRVVEVTRTGLGEGADASERIMWEATGRGTDCVVGVPFRYGELEGAPDPERRYTEAKPLELGASYEIFVELTNGAGSGQFTLNADGTIANDD